jgi:acyl-CoA dehydrogenase
MLGPEGQALRSVLKGTFTLDRTLIATRALATAELAFDLTLDYVKNRKVFGQPLFEFQNTQFKLAEMKTDLVAGAAFRDSLLRQLVEGRLDVLTATTAKLWFTEMEYRLIDTYARVEPIYGGTSEIQKVNIAKSLR